MIVKASFKKTANIATEAGLSDLVEISLASITNTQIF